jgi:hypothetical protein
MPNKIIDVNKFLFNMNRSFNDFKYDYIKKITKSINDYIYLNKNNKLEWIKNNNWNKYPRSTHTRRYNSLNVSNKITNVQNQ